METYNSCANPHAPAAAKPVVDRPSEGSSGDATDVVHCKSETGAAPVNLCTKIVPVGVHAVQATHE